MADPNPNEAAASERRAAANAHNPNRAVAVGDVVRLKSGGAPMAVDGFIAAPVPPPGTVSPADRLVRCIWHKEDGALCEASFWGHVLVLVDPSSPEAPPRS